MFSEDHDKTREKQPGHVCHTRAFCRPLLPAVLLRKHTNDCKGNADSGNEIARVTPVTVRTRDLQRKAELRWEGDTINGEIDSYVYCKRHMQICTT